MVIRPDENNKGRIFFSSKLLVLCFVLCAVILFLWIIYPDRANSGPYLNSAHGSSSYGVNRTSLSTFGYSRANCAHCHEQHASIGGAEPNPNAGDAAGPDKYCLLSNNFNTSKTAKPYSQSDDVCFYCHVDTVTGTYQSPAFNNYSYSITFGGNPDTTPATIFEAFNLASYHNLYDIYRLITGLYGSKTFSSFPADTNPCSGCHNVHIAKRSCGKPPLADSYDPTKSAISKPSDHSNLWGDDTSERMNIYTSNYQAPYWYNSTTYFEPYSTNTTQDGSNLPDYVTFCIDCHTSTANSVWSTTLNGWLRPIDWNNEKHGKGNADGSLCGKPPYPSGTSGLGKVLSCLDCHEPHGSPNATLIRKEVNSGLLGGTISTIASSGCLTSTDHNKEIAYLCNRCHKDDNEIDATCQSGYWYITHHENTGCNSDRPYNPQMCSGCHGGGGGGGSGCTSNQNAINCNCCHYHGSSRTDCDYAPTTRRTF